MFEVGGNPKYQDCFLLTCHPASLVATGYGGGRAMAGAGYGEGEGQGCPIRALLRRSQAQVWCSLVPKFEVFKRSLTDFQSS